MTGVADLAPATTIRPRFTWVICALALIGVALSAYTLHLHYKPSGDSFCDIGETFNCDMVNQSIYSVFLGVPVSLIGLVGYTLLIVLSVLRNRAASWFLFAAALVGLGFCLYLTYIEARVLATWCLLCLGSLAMITGIVTLSAVRVFRPPAGRPV
ncbi:MAG TPA: vitamin K epoxide reductase family protein [Terriglobales bacterium]|nr:vitamin K epoxide reductase family protein [Terriglobales bacterium]